MPLKFIVFLLLLFVLNSNSVADTNETIEEYDYIDKTHEALSKKVIDYSYMLDSSMSSIINNDENSTVPLVTKDKSIDSFLLNEKYIDETDSGTDDLVHLDIREETTNG